MIYVPKRVSEAHDAFDAKLTNESIDSIQSDRPVTPDEAKAAVEDVQNAGILYSQTVHDLIQQVIAEAQNERSVRESTYDCTQR